MGDYTRELKAFSVQSKDIVEYTRDYILSMPVGKELDSLVDKHIMNPEASELMDEMTWFTPKGEIEREYPAYSSDISAAWEVVEHLRKEHDMKLSLEMKLFNGCYVFIKNDMGGMVTGLLEFEEVPEAICKTALLAVMGL